MAIGRPPLQFPARSHRRRDPLGYAEAGTHGRGGGGETRNEIRGRRTSELSNRHDQQVQEPDHVDDSLESGGDS